MLGGGQLGRMFALAARRLGYRVATLDPTPDSPCAQVADEQVTAAFDDVQAALRLGELSQAVTYEFENVDVRCVQALEKAGRVVRPGSKVLQITQDRILEKAFARKAGVGTADFRRVASGIDLDAAMREVGFPAVVKTARGGYDGKGQAVVKDRARALDAFEAFRGRTLIWEKKIPFVRELGVVCARGADGGTAVYPPTENVHVDNILDASIAPAPAPERVLREARRIAERLAKALGLVGVFCVELFELKDGRLLMNEIAPRPHNSGHYTIDACRTSQFEQQLRALCGLPLGSTELMSAAAMVNILGNGKGDALAGVEKALREPRARLHLYGKAEAKPKRKMGHVTVLAPKAAEALRIARRVHGELSWKK